MSTTASHNRRFLLSGRWTPAEIRAIPESLGNVQIAEGEIVITRERTAPQRRAWTDEELMALPEDGNRYELLDGELIMSPPPGHIHGNIVALLAMYLNQAVLPGKLGRVYDQSGFRNGPKNCLAPDISFVSRGKLPAIKRARRPFPNVAPDLAIEVKSPSDRMSLFEQRMGKYFAAGTREVWLVMPERQEVRVYRGPETFVTFGRDETSETDVILGFKLPLENLFQDD